VVGDDGPGLPAGFDPAQSRGLGMRLIVSLVAQLHGTLDARNAGGGARFAVRCPVGMPA
jgi:two-component sensor histidine kinase